MGGAGLCAAFIFHQARIDELDFILRCRRPAFGVDLITVFTIHAQQGVGFTFDAVEGQLVIQIDLGVLVEILVVGVAIGLGHVQHLVGFIQQKFAVAIVVQMGFVECLRLFLICLLYTSDAADE